MEIKDQVCKGKQTYIFFLQGLKGSSCTGKTFEVNLDRIRNSKTQMIWCLMRQQEWVRPRDSSWEGLRQRQRKRGGGEDRLWGLCHSRFQQSHQDSPKLLESSGRSGEPLLCVPPSDRLYFNWSGNFRHLACKPWLRGTVLGDPAISSWNYLSIKYLCVCVGMCVCVCVCLKYLKFHFQAHWCLIHVFENIPEEKYKFKLWIVSDQGQMSLFT